MVIPATAEILNR